MSKLECKHDRLARACTECEAEETILALRAKLQAAEAFITEYREAITRQRTRAEAAEAEWDALLRPGDWVEAQIKSGKVTLGAQIIDKQNAEIDRLQAEVARLKARVIPESGGHLESADCWCGPTVEEHPGGTLIIHNQTH